MTVPLSVCLEGQCVGTSFTAREEWTMQMPPPLGGLQGKPAFSGREGTWVKGRISLGLTLWLASLSVRRQPLLVFLFFCFLFPSLFLLFVLASLLPLSLCLCPLCPPPPFPPSAKLTDSRQQGPKRPRRGRLRFGLNTFVSASALGLLSPLPHDNHTGGRHCPRVTSEHTEVPNAGGWARTWRPVPCPLL